MEIQYASNGKGNLGVTPGAIGTGLSVLNGGLGLLNNGVPANNYVTKDELNYVQTISNKDCEISLLKAESDSEKKMIDVFERLSARISADEKEQNAINGAQAVYNANSNSAIAVLQDQVSVLNGLTKTVVPIGNVCPQPMPQYNSWTAPTTPTTTTAVSGS